MKQQLHGIMTSKTSMRQLVSLCVYLGFSVYWCPFQHGLYECTCTYCSSLYPQLTVVSLWARAGCKKTSSLLHYPRKINFIHSFIHPLSLSSLPLPPLSSPSVSPFSSLSDRLCLCLSACLSLLVDLLNPRIHFQRILHVCGSCEYLSQKRIDISYSE